MRRTHAARRYIVNKTHHLTNSSGQPSVLSRHAPVKHKATVTLEPSIEGFLEPVHPDETVSEHMAPGSRWRALSPRNQTKELGKVSGESAMALTNAVGAIRDAHETELRDKELEFELAQVAAEKHR